MMFSVRHAFLNVAVFLYTHHIYSRFDDGCLQRQTSWQGDTVINQPCHLPKLDPFDESYWEMLRTKPQTWKMQCDNSFPLLKLQWNATHAYLNESERGLVEIAKLRKEGKFCLTREIQRQKDDKSVAYGKAIPMMSFPFEVIHEHIEVRCGSIYRDVFAVIQPKRMIPQQNEGKWNVLVVGIDSLSRADMMRSLPQTYKWLREQDNAVIFEGYNKIGENSFPNVVPMLSGIRMEKEFGEVDFERIDKILRIDRFDDRVFDRFPLVWKEYENAGYRTSFIMNMVYWDMFHYTGKGFRNPPTHHYGRPFFISQENDITEENNPGIKNSLGMLENCAVGVFKYRTVWEYGVRQWIERYSALNQSTFGFTWAADLCHLDDSFIRNGDEPLLDLMKHLTFKDYSSKNRPWIDNTIVFLLSDHGVRTSKRRATLIGRVEERLPFLSIILPEKFRQLFPKISTTMKSNQDKLVSAFDIWATFRHILEISKGDAGDDPQFDERGEDGFARSLFTPLQSDRSCAEAGIQPWNCACQRFSPVNASDVENSSEAAKLVIDYLNAQLDSFARRGQCHNISYRSIQSMNKLEMGKSLMPRDSSCYKSTTKSRTFRDYLIQVRTGPVDGIFEASLRNEGASWKLMGAVERVNLYGNQSACLQSSEKAVKKICSCVNV